LRKDPTMSLPEVPVATVHRDVEAPASAVWQVLTDGWTYANWVVGASRVRDVDPHWPEVGSRIKHAVGLWPAVIQDSTSVEQSEPERLLVLKARGWPVGEARVALRIEPTGPESCRLEIAEDAVAGPGKWALPRPLRQVAIAPRNREALYRLALIAEGRHRNKQVPGSTQAQNTPDGPDRADGPHQAPGNPVDTVDSQPGGMPPGEEAIAI
ncbi:MAG TPA: SRPBCC family protein, partial [Candidatus Nanopelagicales bacterium]